MASADKPLVADLTPVEAQRIAERAAETLIAPGHVEYPGESEDSSGGKGAFEPRSPAGGAPAKGNRDSAAASGAYVAPVEAQRIAERAVEALFARDATKELLGIRVIGARPGGAQVGMTVRRDMVNGHRTCHGGLIFSLADSAFAAACNSHNEGNVAAAASIDFLAPAFEGDDLTAEASEVWRAGRTGIYEIKVTNQRGELIALFRGRSHRIGGAVATDQTG
jgi:acyl-CoA thioesterase